MLLTSWLAALRLPRLFRRNRSVRRPQPQRLALNAGQCCETLEIRTLLTSGIQLDNLDANIVFDFADVNNSPQYIDSDIYTARDTSDSSIDPYQITFGLTNALEGDSLRIANQGSGLGQIGISGNQIQYEGSFIGIFNQTDNSAAGSYTLDCFIAFGVSDAKLSALLQAVQFSTSSVTPATGDRNLSVTQQASSGVGNLVSTLNTVISVQVSNTAPAITSNGGGNTASVSVNENTSVVTTVTATDTDLPAQSLTYSISGGTDQTLFSINPTTGVLQFVSPPDYENPTDSNTDNVYEVIVRVTDDNASPLYIEQTISVTVLPVNENPHFTSGTSFSIAENTTAVTTVTAADGDLPVQTLTYSITGGADQALFTINPTTGALSFLTARNYELPQDNDSQNDYIVDITASDGNGGSVTQTLTVTVTDVNENPNFTSGTSVSIAENTTAVANIVASDEDLPAQTLIYVISGGADLALFSINPLTGALSFVVPPNFESPLDSDHDNDYVVQVTVGDLHGGVAMQTIVVTITDVNENPVFTSGTTFSIAENTTAVATSTAVDEDQPAQTLTFSITGGADQALFAINPTTGALSFAVAPDFETPLDSDHDNDYVVHVTVSDGHGGTATQTVTVTITDVNENPVFTSGTTFNIAENTTAVTTTTAVDEDQPAQTLTFSITGGADQALFAINPTTGALSFAVAPDFETPLDSDHDNDYVVDVTVSDGHGGSATQTVTVTVTDVNENPVFTSGTTFNIAENTTAVATNTAVDEDLPAQTLTFSITGGADQALFAINPTTGALSFAVSPDFETPLDSDHDNDYAVDVTVSDGHGGTATQTVTVTITDVNENPVFISGTTFSIAENTTAVATSTAVDEDQPAQTLTFSITGGADQALFAINPTTGALSFAVAPDFETPLDSDHDNDYVVQVTVSDGHGGTATQTVTVTITDVNENPVFTSGTTFSIAENTTAVATSTAVDEDQPAQTLTFSITGGADQALFTINPTTGSLSFAVAPDFETPLDSDHDNEYVVDVTVSDGHGGTATQTVTVTITDVNENPVFISGTTFNIAENTTAVATSTAADEDQPAQTLTFSITGGADQALFAINPTTGALSFAVAPDFETPPDSDHDNDYVVDITVSDGHGGLATQTVTVTVTDVNENPVFTSGTTFSIAENTTAVATSTAVDEDQPAQTLTFSITGGADQALFAINPTTGALSFAGAPDFETPLDSDHDNDYVVQVTVSDGHGGTATQTVTVTITDVNENPVFTSGTTFSIAENTTAVATSTAVDEDQPAQTLSFSITGGADQGLFTINPTTGALSFAVAPDFEALTDANADNDYVVQVTVSDGHGGSATQTVTVTVTDVNENPLFTSGADYNILENTSAVATVTALDEDLPAQSLTYSITGGPDQALFTIDSITGALSFAAAPDFESSLDSDHDNDYVVDVTVSDGHGGSATQTIVVTVINVNENPIFTSGTSFSIAENTTAVTSFSAADEDLPAQTLTYHITGGADEALFTINPTTGALTFNVAPDFESPLDSDHDNDYVVEVTVSDGHGGSAIQTVTVTVTDVNENPAFTSGTAFSIAENSTAITTATAVDQDLPAQSLTYSLTGGADHALFTIHPTTGVLTFTVAPDFESSSDSDHDNDYVVDITVSDGHGGSAMQTVTVTVTDVNENPVFTSGTSFSVAENTTAVATISASDEDQPTQSLTYSLTGGADLALFTINPTTGALRFVAAPDFESPLDSDVDNDYLVEVTVSDGHGGSATQTVTVTVTDVNENPVFTSGTSFSMAENSTAITTVTAADEDQPTQTLTYSITGGDDGALFTINPSTGALNFATAPDFESSQDSDHDNEYVVEVTVGDGHGGHATQLITIHVTGINDNSPAFISPSTFDVLENHTAVGTIQATDADVPAQSVTYSITGGADQALFTIHPTTGSLAFLAPPDYELPADTEAGNVYHLTITASDNAGLITQLDLTITVIAVNDNEPEFTSPAEFSLAENSTAVGTVTAIDADLPHQTLTYSITGGADQARLTIDPLTGALTFLQAPDYEAPDDADTDHVYHILVTVSDNAGFTSTQSVTITVTPVNETAPLFTSPASFSLAENSTAVGTVTAVDADRPLQTLSFSITGGIDAALLTIDPYTGALAFLQAPDFEHPADVGAGNDYHVQVTVQDAGGLLSVQDVVVTVTNVIEDPVITLNPATAFYTVGKTNGYLDPRATFQSDSTLTDYSQAVLTAAITANRQPRDLLDLKSGGKLEVRRKTVYYGGIAIGTLERSRQNANTEFSVRLNSAATRAAVEALLRQINFSTKKANSPQPVRTLSVSISNVSGHDSNLASRQLVVANSDKHA